MLCWERVCCSVARNNCPACSPSTGCQPQASFHQHSFCSLACCCLQVSSARLEVVNANGNLNGAHPDPLDETLHARIEADSLVSCCTALCDGGLRGGRGRYHVQAALTEGAPVGSAGLADVQRTVCARIHSSHWSLFCPALSACTFDRPVLHSPASCKPLTGLSCPVHPAPFTIPQAKLQKAADMVCQVLSPSNASFEPLRVEPGGSARLTVVQPVAAQPHSGGPKSRPAGHSKVGWCARVVGWSVCGGVCVGECVSSNLGSVCGWTARRTPGCLFVVGSVDRVS